MALRVLIVAALGATLIAAAELPPLSWAFVVNPPGYKPDPDNGQLHSVPGSTERLTLTQARNPFAAPDWHHLDHPAMPEIVAHGRRPDIFACAFCHRANGAGAPENANLTGLTADYIERQVRAFASGQRSAPDEIPHRLMVRGARALSETELQAAADYFAALPRVTTAAVVETTTVPRTNGVDWHLVPDPKGGTEPIGQRIIEVPDDPELVTLRDGRARYTAYVPPGSVERGRILATTGLGHRTVACVLCHGGDLRGTEIAPTLRGRSPSYVVRQLHAFGAGDRRDESSVLMQPVVQNLTLDDIIDLAAYIASLKG